jgi:ribokinase
VAGQPGRVVVIGSVNVDMVMRLPALPAPGQTVLGGELSRGHGGKGANQAVAAARAGARVYMIGAVGAADGAPSAAALVADGVDVASLARVDAATGHALVLVDHDGENQIAVASGANALLTPEHVLAALARLAVTMTDVVVLSFEIPEAALRAAASAVAEADCQLVVNPAPVRPRSLDVLAGAIATPNRHELAALAADLPGAAEPGATEPGAAEPGAAEPGPADAAMAVARHTGGIVVATLGPDGALLADPGQASPTHIAGHQVAVRDTTGAGDTFTGVLAASLAAGHDVPASVRRAVAASALSVTEPGARAGMPVAARIDALARRADS